MATAILATKLYTPPPPQKAVLRPRLIERLNQGLQRKLTLISAPAGFGKTTLVSEWIAGSDRQVAWLSLDEGDSEPVRFLTYLVAALRKVTPDIGEGVLDVLQSPQPPPIEPILTALLNEITTVPDNFVLVLDDYHVIEGKSIDDVIIFLIEHLPPQMHLVITTREDPALPIPRLRARDQLVELRGSDLEEGESQGLPAWSRHVGDPILASNITRRVDYALFMVEALNNDALIHEAPAIVGCQTTSALAHAVAQ